MSNYHPAPDPHAYGQHPQAPQGPPPPPPPPQQQRYERSPHTARRTALVIHTIADIAAAFLGLWILLFLLEANSANVFVEFVRGTADLLAWWSQDIFTMDTEGLRVVLNYGLPAVIYLAVGHGIAARVGRA